MTRFNILAGTAIVPVLARLVLCAAFITAGWNKLMNVQEFTGEAAAALLDRGVADVVRSATVHTQPAALSFQDDPDEPAEEPPADEPDTPAAPAIVQPPPDVVEVDPVTGERTLIAKRMHGVTLMLINRGVEGRWPVRLAGALVITELVAGALILIGLFTRVWAIAIAFIMIVAFWLTSLGPLIEFGGPFGVAADMTGGYANFNRLYAQLGLLALAVGVALSGPGPASLDRLLFRPKESTDYEHDFR